MGNQQDFQLARRSIAEHGPRQPLRDVAPNEVVTCEICDGSVNLYTMPDGAEAWVHARPWIDRDHEAAAKIVLLAEHPNRVCDFCANSTRMYWSFVGSNIEGRVAGVVQHYGEGWSACEPCGALIRRGDYNGLVARVTHIMAREHGFTQPERQQHLQDDLRELWGQFLPTVHTVTYIGPRIEPAKLNPRMMPKLQQGLIKFWKNPGMLDWINRSQMQGSTHSVPGVHTGNDDVFAHRYSAGETIPAGVWNNFTDHITAGIRASSLYWISSTFTQLAVMAGKDFTTLSFTREELPAAFGFLVYEQPIGTLKRTDGDADIRAVSWTLVPGGIWLALYVQGEDGDADCDIEKMRRETGYLISLNNGTGFPFGHDLPVDLLSEETQFLTTIFATWFLMIQPGVTDYDTAPVDKKIARAYQREHHRELPDVQLVDLRKRHRPATTKPQDGTGRPLEYRVLRRGHWKEQAYGPGHSLRRPIYVSPYIAGPADAPLKEKPATVNVLR